MSPPADDSDDSVGIGPLCWCRRCRAAFYEWLIGREITVASEQGQEIDRAVAETRIMFDGTDMGLVYMPESDWNITCSACGDWRCAGASDHDATCEIVTGEGQHGTQD